MSKSVAVVGAGWAGLAAAVRATEAGHRVTLFEMAREAGGRARGVESDGVRLDNGQHILIGAYRETLALMRTVGADPDLLLDRRPLALQDAHGRGLALRPGPAVPAFVRAVAALRHWTLGERAALLLATLRWRRGGFAAAADATVADLVRDLPARARDELIDPLCVAALNTPANQASARVFLRVLRDALFSGRGAADLLLPRASLSALLPLPALAWLAARGARLRLGVKVDALTAEAGCWRVDGEAHDAVLLACTAKEAARLAAPHAADWSRRAAALSYEPIVTVYLRSAGSRLPQPITALRSDAERPAQFAFDLGALDAHGGRAGLFAFVVSGAKGWVERGLEATAAATLEQARSELGAAWVVAPHVLRTIAERRATFLCAPRLDRPPAAIAPGLAAAGDYIDGPYPATLEGAVRSALEGLTHIL
ncbi:MAG TPA: hydroxysqualene dehydroxylase HpnE [Burkholderiaceae bacterium]|nr:hydroxysqualene dehydroxylase HpnE [Burkholderiaceae bacterium]